MKRSVWTAVGAMVLAAAVAIPVIAQPPQGGRGPGRGPGPGGPLPILRGLDLTDAQKEQIKTLTEQRRTGEDPRRNLMDLERQLQTEFRPIPASPAAAQRVYRKRSIHPRQSDG